MTLFIFKYCLPALLGYTLFVGLAGRLNPLTKPFYIEERPAWFLGVWTGLSVASALGVSLHLAYGLPLEAVETLVKPTVITMAALLLTGIVGYVIYRQHTHRLLSTGQPQASGRDHLHVADGFAKEFDDNAGDANAASGMVDRLESTVCNSESALQTIREESPLVATFLDSADVHVLDTQEMPAALNDDDQAPVDQPPDVGADDLLNQTGLEEFLYTTAELDASVLLEDSLTDPDTALSSDDASNLSVTADARLIDHCDLDETIRISEDNEQVSETVIEFDQLDQTSGRKTAHKPAATAAKKASDALSSLEARLLDEQSAHQETAKHLRITRKALATLETESRLYESLKADSLIDLEEKLARSINRQVTTEAEATQEKDKRVSAETTIVNLKQELVKAKQEIRRSTAARAKALSTANKSIAFARQAVQARAQLEADLEQLRDTLNNRQTTISSLIRELEREKRRTQDEISTMASQLVLHDKQLKARRSLEEVARSVENKLSSRLVKKVAKARPLISDL